MLKAVICRKATDILHSPVVVGTGGGGGGGGGGGDKFTLLWVLFAEHGSWRLINLQITWTASWRKQNLF